MSALVPFGRDQAWLAVRDRPQEGVLEALGLTGGRVTEVDEAVREALGDATAVLPPLPGEGGRWTLVLGQDVRAASRARVTTLSAMLGTGVQAFGSVEDGSRQCLRIERGRVEQEVDATPDELPALARQWSVDPTGLDGPAPGSALLVGALRAEPPTPENDPEVVDVMPRKGGFLTSILGGVLAPGERRRRR